LPHCMNAKYENNQQKRRFNNDSIIDNSRTHYAAQTGYVARDGKSYSPSIAYIENEGTIDEIVHYYKNLRVSSDVSPRLEDDGTGNLVLQLEGIDNINAHYRTINENRTEILQRPVIVYNEENGNEWTPWADGFEWETTTDVTKAWRDYDIAACPTLDYSEVLVPGERVKILRTETHFYWKTADGRPQTAAEVVIVEPPNSYNVEFEGTSDALEFGIFHKERMLTNNQSDVVRTTIDVNFNIGTGDIPYDYWGFDTVDLLPNGMASWNFIQIAAYPKLETIQNENNSPYIDDTHVSRPILSDTVNIRLKNFPAGISRTMVRFFMNKTCRYCLKRPLPITGYGCCVVMAVSLVVTSGMTDCIVAVNLPCVRMLMTTIFPAGRMSGRRGASLTEPAWTKSGRQIRAGAIPCRRLQKILPQKVSNFGTTTKHCIRALPSTYFTRDNPLVRSS